jgi:DNA ligase-1
MISEKNMMHGVDYLGEDVSGWLMSEKYDGCRAYWDGETMWSRGGKVIAIPEAMRAALPSGGALDGEIHAGRGGFEVARQAVQYGRWTPECRFSVFDVPSLKDHPFYIRYEALERELPADGQVNYVRHLWCRDVGNAVNYMKSIQFGDGEGVVLRDPSALYVSDRVESVLKLKEVPELC